MFAHLRGIVRILFDFVRAEEVEDNDAPVIAKEAWKYLIECFGTPADSAIPYKLIRGKRTDTVYHPFKKLFYIMLEREIKQASQYCAVISREMYHRITYAREGLHSIALIDEALAHLASRWFLKQHGLEEYANMITNGFLLPAEEMTIQDAMQLQRHDLSSLNPSNKKVRSQFYDCVARTALFLEGWISKEQICQMVDSPSWESWLSQLDIFKAKRAKQYFGFLEAESASHPSEGIRSYFQSGTPSLSVYKRPDTQELIECQARTISEPSFCRKLNLQDNDPRT